MENEVLRKCFQAPCFCGAGARPVGMGLPPSSLGFKLNRLRTGVGRFHLFIHKWGLAPSPNCEYGASEQTADHVLTACPIHRAPHAARGLTVLVMTKFNAGLTTSLPAFDPGSTAVWSSKRINSRPQSCLCLIWSGYLFKRSSYSSSIQLKSNLE